MWTFLMMMFFILLFFIFLFFPLELFNIAIPDFPLSDFASQVIGDWGSGCCSFFLDIGIDGLDLSSLVIELVSHGLLDSLYIFA